MNRPRYPSDLSNEQWQAVEPLLSKTMGRPPTVDRREVVNAIPYLVRTGCQWRYLPQGEAGFPNWASIYSCYRRWRLDGTLDQLHAALRRQVRVAAGREPEPSIAVVDSQSVKTTEKGDPEGTTRART